VTAEKSLYTYQIDSMNKNIIERDISKSCPISLQDSMGNTIVIETWLHQVKTKHATERAIANQM